MTPELSNLTRPCYRSRQSKGTQHHSSRLAITLVLLVTLLSGCSSLSNNTKSFNQDIQTGDYENAQTLATEQADKNNRHSLLWQLQAGIAARHNMDFHESNRLFDLAESAIKIYEEKTVTDSTGQTISTILINDRTTPYQPKSYDSIMVNTYKGLNYLALGEADGARVEFNRAIDRQRRAVHFFNQEIKKENRVIAHHQQKQPSAVFDTNRTLSNQDLDNTIQAHQEAFPELQAYPDFVNPFTTYMAGLFALFDRDYNKASYLFKRTSSMIPDNPFTAEDFKFVEQTINTGQPFPPSVWVILENGTGPFLNEFRIDIPIFLVSNQVLYSGVALPTLRHGRSAVTAITINSDKKDVETVELANMDQIIHREFTKRYGAIVRRSLLSAVIKSSMQYVAQKNTGTLGLFATTLFHVATTRADTRIWTGLPHSFQIARVNKPQENKLTIYPESQPPIVVQLTAAPFTLIYVTIPAYTSKPIIQVYSY